MKRILVYVEGPTEETFIKNILYPHLYRFNLHIIPTIATTKYVLGGPNHKGGFVPYAKAKREILRLLGDTDAVTVTTMLDFYGLPTDYPGKDDIPQVNCYERVKHLEIKLGEDISRRKFIPYFSLHEFEALLFSSPDQIAKAFPDRDVRSQIYSITSSLQSPEEINEGPSTHPSMRLETAIPAYRKLAHGPLIVQRIGLETLRNRCPHFKDWLCKLENLA